MVLNVVAKFIRRNGDINLFVINEKYQENNTIYDKLLSTMSLIENSGSICGGIFPSKTGDCLFYRSLDAYGDMNDLEKHAFYKLGLYTIHGNGKYINFRILKNSCEKLAKTESKKELNNSLI